MTVAGTPAAAAPEFSRPVRLDTLGEGPRAMPIAATPDERLALARRFGLAALEMLEADATLRRDGARVFVEGRLRAGVVQHCVATGDPVPAAIDAAFSLRFDPEVPAAGEEEIELSEADLDVVHYAGGAIDLGEAVAETLALELDPFPRCADADERLRAAGVLSEGEAGPFAALAALKDKLGK